MRPLEERVSTAMEDDAMNSGASGPDTARGKTAPALQMSKGVARNSDRLKETRRQQLKRSAVDDGEQAPHYVRVDDDELVIAEVPVRGIE